MSVLFAYGTMRHPDVVEALTPGQRRVKEDVYVHNYVCYPVINCLYPAAIPAPASPDGAHRVVGSLIYDLDVDDMAVLDEFEDEYIAETVPVYTRDGEFITDAMFYVWKKSPKLLDTTREWVYEEDFLPFPEMRKRMIDNGLELRRMALSDM